MFWVRIIFLLTALAMTSGYRFRCYLFCTDQTGIQHDYIEQRDRCREYAQLKLDMAAREAGGPGDEKSRKGQLVTLFSQCMGNSGWTVPDGKGEGKDKKADAGGAVPIFNQPAAIVAAPPPPKIPEKAVVSRSAECAFARHSAGASTIAAARAEACDIECAQRLKKLAPGAERPAACSPEVNPKLAVGSEQ